MVADEFDGTREVRQALSSFEGHRLRVLAHHRPPEPIQQDRWGGGSCMFEGQGECPFGHHANPNHLFTFNKVGELRHRFLDGRDAWVVGADDLEVDLLVGHRSQITIINLPDFEEIDRKVQSFNPDTLEGSSVDEMIEHVSSLRDYLSQLQDMAKDL